MLDTVPCICHIWDNVQQITRLGSYSSLLFNFFIFVNSNELLSYGPYGSFIGQSIIKLLGTEFIISHASVTFLFLVLDKVS